MNKEEAIQILKNNSLNLKFLPADLRKDENIVLRAIEQY